MNVKLLTKKMADAIRILAVDAIQQAKSGHPGMPMGMAEIAVALWTTYYCHNPLNPKWVNRDRFVLSNGHGSMLHYALLHLTGYDVSIEDIKNFRQLHSKTPGHPEVNVTPGIETTTGPLGQGLANAIGMALAEKLLAAEFNKPNLEIINHYTYVFVGDGCMMEGISHEVCSLAGTLCLSKLIVLYDDNGISIDGDVKNWFADDTCLRFQAYGWHVISNIDGHSVEDVRVAIGQAKSMNKPTLICCKTTIGKGSPNLAGTDKIHGAALGEDEIKAVRSLLNWTSASFEIPAEIYTAWDHKILGEQIEAEWNNLFSVYKMNYPHLASEFMRRVDGQLPVNFEEIAQIYLTHTISKKENIATRQASQNTIQAYAKILPELLGGSADLTNSNLTHWKQSISVRVNKSGNYINYGVREFGMAAIANGIALHGGYIPFCGTFLTFSDYSRNALRMAALMKIRTIFIFTHDSIGLGEDGPTHQSIEHLSSLRLIPQIDIWRPCDTVESAIAWQQAIKRDNGPTTLIFSRQNLFFQERTSLQIENIKRGGYILINVKNPKVILIATGSEVELAVQAYKKLKQCNIAARVVSMPSTEVFDRQNQDYQISVLHSNIPRVAIEAGTTAFWYKYVGLDGIVIGIDTFGESASADVLFKYFGFTIDNVVTKIQLLLLG